MFDIAKVVAEYLPHNLRFIIPLSRLQFVGLIPGIAFRVEGTPQEFVECVIDESQYKVAKDYKIKLKALDPTFGSEIYYTSDLNQILSNYPDTHKVYVLDIDGYTRLN